MEAGSRQPFPIDDPKYSWFVTKGAVDVFVLPMASGKPAGPRSHLLRARAGEVIFGLRFDGAESGLGFVAVGGPDTCIHRLPVARLAVETGDAAANAQLQDWIETWVGALCCGLAAAAQVERIVFGGSPLRDNAVLQDVLRLICLALGRQPTFLPQGEFAGALGALERVAADVAR